MKAKFYLLALATGAALAVSMQADDRHGGENSAVAPSAPAAHASTTSVHSISRGNFVGGRTMIPGQRYSSIGMRSTPTAFRQYYVNPNKSTLISRQFTPNTLNRTEGLTRFSDPETRSVRFQNRRGDRFGQIGNRNRGLSAGAGHVFARRSAAWHRDWDRNRDHWWHGHRCRFLNGSWVIFDLGFYPWWWTYGYPYDYYYPYNYYPNNYYPYGYDPGVYGEGDAEYYGRGTEYGGGAYDSSEQSTDQAVAAVQARLARDGYYRGKIDGILGPETRRAILSFQSDHGLRVTGNLTRETLSTLGL
jgi:Putative peptidoglycan binding domain